MGNRNHYKVLASDDSDPVEIFGEFLTNGAGVPATTAIKGCVATAVRTGTGTFALTLREGFPKLLAARPPTIVGAGAHRAFFTALDVVAKTATVELRDATDAAADAAADTIYLSLLVSNTKLAKIPRT